jgi:hypothetical protein
MWPLVPYHTNIVNVLAQWAIYCYVFCMLLVYVGFVGGHAFSSAHYGQGEGQIWLDNLHCSGSESKLSLCSHLDWGDHNCGHHEDAGVMCGKYAPVKAQYDKLSLLASDMGTEFCYKWDQNNENPLFRQFCPRNNLIIYYQKTLHSL